MVAVRSLALYVSIAAGARIAKRGGQKFIAGVPVLNYQVAYGGESLGELGTEEEWVVMVKPGVTDVQIEQMCHTAKNGCNFAGNPSKGGVPFFEMRGTESELAAVIESGHGAVKFVEPDETLYDIPELMADEVEESNLWGLERVGAYQRASVGTGVAIFVVDTGVRHSHNDFGDRGIPALDYSSGSEVVCNGNANCAGDVHGHGTHCAGSAAGRNYGVAPAAKIYGTKVMTDQGSGQLSWRQAALNWMATSSIRPAVASISLGRIGSSEATKAAVDAATNAFVTVVVAGGNSNTDACAFEPAFVPSAITVGATDSRDSRSSFSNYGACTNIWAPGSSILSAHVRSDSATATWSGTSMACPHVAGGAALVLQRNPSFNYEKVLETMHDDAINDALSGLYASDTNKLLYVGA